MSPDRLIYMANQIGKYFESQHHIDPVAGIADHLRKFWDPRMRQDIIAYVEQGGGGLDLPVQQAVQSLGQWQMRIVGLAGWSGSGKTSLLAKLIPLLTARGLSVSTIKHAHHEFDIDQPGKDSWVHRQAGATEVLVASVRRYALMRELRDQQEPTLGELMAKLAPVDIVLIEGFKRDPHPKIEIHRPELGKPTLYPDDRWIMAVASPEPLADLPVPWLPLDSPAAIAAFIVDMKPEAPRP